MKIYIYAFYFPINNKYYIGQTNNLQATMRRHLNRDYPVGNALRKYDDWTVEVLHTTKDRDVANLLEIEEIRHYNCIAPNGYNLTRGGEGSDYWKGKCFSDEHKKNMRGIKKPGTGKALSKRLQGNQYRKGSRHTEESIQRMRSNKNALKNGEHTKDAQLKRLKTRIANLEKDINNAS